MCETRARIKGLLNAGRKATINNGAKNFVNSNCVTLICLPDFSKFREIITNESNINPNSIKLPNVTDIAAI